MPATPPSHLSTKLEAGTVVAGRYRITREIGRGGMAQVYEGTHVDIGRSVAVKVLSAEFITSPVVVERFLREARAAAAVRSPFICDVYDSGKLDDGRPFLVMELLEGESLYERMCRIRQFDAKTTLRIMAHAARGLTKAHAANIVHRDLKPENIFLTTNEEGELHAKILDFGLAKFYAPATGGEAQARLTREGAIFGTPAYMSPEQVQGQGTVDARADVWALGCITYECLTGRTVWSTDKGIAMTFAQIASAPIPRVTRYRPDLPKSIDSWFEKALAREPEERFQSARELAEALASALEEGPPSILVGSEGSVLDQPLVSSALRDEIAKATEGPTSSTDRPPTAKGLTPTPAPAQAHTGPPAPVAPRPSDTDVAATLRGSPPQPPSRSGAGKFVALVGLLVLGGAAGAFALQYTKTHASHGTTPPASAAPTASSAPAPAASSSSPVAEAAPTTNLPRWAPLVIEGQAKVLEGSYEEAQKRFKEAQDTLASAVGKSMGDHVSAAISNKGPCKLGAVSRLRPLSFTTGNAGRPAMVATPAGLLSFWADDHEMPQRDHVYAQVLDATTLKPIGNMVDVTPEVEKVGRFAVIAAGERVALAYTETRGNAQGLSLRWLGGDGRITAPPLAVAQAKASLSTPNLALSGDTVHIAWEERGDADKTDLMLARIAAGALEKGPTRVTDLRKGHIMPRVAAPQIAVTQAGIEAVFRVDRDALHPVAYLHIPAADPGLDKGLAAPKPVEAKIDRFLGQYKELSPAKDKSDAPDILCGKEGCFSVWHIEKTGNVGGWYAALLDPSTGAATWSKRFPGAGSRPALGVDATGKTQVAWYEAGKVRMASVHERDGVGPHSILASVAGDQPPPTVVGLGDGTWVVSWLNFEGGRLEPYVLRATCR